MGTPTFRFVTATSLTLIFLMLFSCQRVEDSKIELTQSQWQDIQQHLLDERPSPEHDINVEFGDEIELIGLDIDGDFVTGEEIELTWYWHASEDIDQDWQIFVHFDSNEEPFRQNLDHYPLGQMMDNAFRTYHWEEGHIIADTQRFVLSEDYPSGEAVFYVGLFRGEQRSPVSNDGDATDDNRAIGPTVTIERGESEEAASSSSATGSAPQHTIPRLEEAHLEDVEFDGVLGDSFWGDVPSLRLEPLAPGYAQDSIVQAAYAQDHLVVAAQLIDAHLEVGDAEDEADAPDGSELWRDDALVVYLAPAGAGGPYVEVQVNPQGIVHGLSYDEPPSPDTPPANVDETRQYDTDRGQSWNPEGLKAGVFLSDAEGERKSWSVELRIPFADLPEVDGSPDEQDTWRVNIVRFDRPAGDEHFAYGWPDTVRQDHHRVDQFGQWTFGPALGDAPGVQQLQADDQRLPEQVREHMRQRRGASDHSE